MTENTDQSNGVRRTSPSRAQVDVGSSEHAGTPGPIERQWLADGFGARLRQLRRRAGLTQRQVAERSGRTPEFISLLERGWRRPESLTVLLLSRALASTRVEQKAVRVELRRLAGDSLRTWRRRDGRNNHAAMETELPAMFAKANRKLRAAGLNELPPLPGAETLPPDWLTERAPHDQGR